MNFSRGVLSVLCAGVLLLATAERASASVNFTVVGADFPVVVGDNVGFTWSVSAASIPTSVGTLNVGETSSAFTYGYFSTTDFGLDAGDVLDPLDFFAVNLAIEPPNPAQNFYSIGSPDAKVSYSFRNGLVQWVDVNFNNNPILVSYSDGLSYELTFLDSGKLYQDGTLDLQATITLISEASANNSVPEPATVLVWSVLGLAFGYRIHRTRANGKKA